jgi:molybdate transport system substrate-binding protein
MRRTIALAISLLSMVTISASPAKAAEIHAFVTGALTGAFRDLAPQFEQMTGNKIIVAWGPSSGTSADAIPVRLQNGERADVLIMVGPGLDKLINDGKFAAASRVEIAESRIGVGVRAGAPKPDVGSVDAVKHTLLAAKSIGYSEGASGVYISTELLKKLGIAEQIAGKARKITGELVGEAVARGEIELALQQISELKTVSGVDFVGPLPEEIQKASPIVAAVALHAKEPDAARAFVTFLSSDEAAPALAKSGLDPRTGDK